MNRIKTFNLFQSLLLTYLPLALPSNRDKLSKGGINLGLIQKLSLLCLIGLFPILLQAQPNPPEITCVNFGNSISSVTWTYQPNVDCNGGVFEEYVIYVSETPEGPFTELGATAAPPPFEQDLTDIPEVLRYYYVTVRCGGQESLPSDTLRNNEPDPPSILNTTVLPDGSVQIAFLPVDDAQIEGYTLFRTENGQVPTEVEGVPSFLEDLTIINDTIYIIDNTGIDARTASIGYRLRSFNCSSIEAENNSELSDTHFTVFVEATVDNCNDLVNLSWTPYVGWNRTDDNGEPIDSVVSYTVYTDTDTTVVNAPTTDLAYTIEPSTAEKCFQIVANNTSGLTSESNEVCIERQASNPPTDICLRVASIDTLNSIVVLEWDIDLNSEITSLQLFRGLSPNALEQLGEISNSSPPLVEIGDPVDINNQGPYFYQIVHLDDCGRRVESNIASTIFLDGRNQLDGSNLLSWTEFNLGEGAEINSYTVYRSEDIPFKNFLPIQTLDSNTFDFQDIVEAGAGSTPSYCYYIAAQYNITCGDGTTVTEISQSNEVCVSQSPRIFVPNAFAPNGVNKVFKPIIKNPNPNDYQMVVFNRWGEHIFTTTDPAEGWNGFYKNRLAPQGVYAYYIRMQSELGFVLERKGTVVLIR